MTMMTAMIPEVAEDAPFRPGEMLQGKIRIDRLVATGGMALVYEATHLGLNERVAVKVLRSRYRDDQELVIRFEREARLNAKIKSEHVARVYDIDRTHDRLPYIVMEMLDGRDLETELLMRGRLPIAEAVGWVMEACIPLAEVHALGVVHRDLKPGNLFLAQSGDHQIVKLLDFGIAKILDGRPTNIQDIKLTRGHAAMGTPYYMSPEQIRTSSDVDARTDIWALGVILYELVTGELPFGGTPMAALGSALREEVTPPRVHRPEISTALESVILQALSKDREARFPDVLAFALALSPFARSKYFHTVRAQLPSRPSMHAPKETLAFELRAPKKRGVGGWVVIGVAIALAIAAAATYSGLGSG